MAPAPRSFGAVLAAFLALPALTGCAAFEARAPRPFVPQVEQVDGLTLTRSTFEGGDGWVHFERSYRPQGRPRGTLVLVHGLKDHSGRYEGVARDWAHRGLLVRSYDHRGHGQSDGLPQRVDAFSDYVSDLTSFVRRAHQEDPGLPLFVFGHSMGGAIATEFALGHPDELNGLVLSAPALATDAGGGAKLGAAFLGGLAPGAAVAPLDLAQFSRAPGAVESLKSDPFVFQADVPAGTIAGLLGAMEHIAKNRAAFTVPLLAIHGEADKVTPPSGTKEFAAGVASKDRTLWLCPGLVHDLVHEPEGPGIVAGIGAWVEAHGGESPAPTAAPAPCRVEPLGG